jgi:hypothetical protein
MTLLVERALKKSVEGVDWIDLAQVTEKWRESCENDNEPRTVKCEEFLD